MTEIRSKTQSFKDLENKMRNELRSDLSKKIGANFKYESGKGKDYTSKYRSAYDV